MGRSPSLPKPHKPRKHQRNEKCSQLVCIIAIPVRVSHHIPLHTVPALPRWERSSNCPATVDELTISQKTQGTNNRSVLTEVQHVQRKMRRQGHLTQLFFVLKNLFRAGCTHFAQKNTTESSPQCAHPPSSSEKDLSSSSSEAS